MTSSREFPWRPSRRQILMTGPALALAPLPALAQVTTTARPQPDATEADRIAAEFAAGALPLPEGLVLDLPVLGDNPGAVPVRVHLDRPVTPDHWCAEMIVIAELNPRPLACRLRFTADTGSADLAVRLRLIRSMHVRALARMNDGRVLTVRRPITVTAGGCGM